MTLLQLHRQNVEIEWGNNPISYSEGAGFIYRPRDLSFWHVFSGYSQPSKQIDGYCMKLCHAAFFHIIHSSLITNQPITRRCIVNLNSTSLCSYRSHEGPVLYKKVKSPHLSTIKRERIRPLRKSSIHSSSRPYIVSNKLYSLDKRWRW